MSSDLDIVGIREATVDDRPFVMDSWLMSFRFSHFSGPISTKRYRKVYNEEIGELKLRAGAWVRVAYNRENPDQIFGFVCFERGHKEPVIHYIYTKQAFRKRGIAKLLLRDASINPCRPFFYTYRTPLAHDLTKGGAKFERGKFSPRIAREEPKEYKNATQSK